MSSGTTKLRATYNLLGETFQTQRGNSSRWGEGQGVRRRGASRICGGGEGGLSLGTVVMPPGESEGKSKAGEGGLCAQQGIWPGLVGVGAAAPGKEEGKRRVSSGAVCQ